MTNILLTLSYDGTDFCGWQRQDGAAAGLPVRTVQGEVEKALCRMLGTDVPLCGSGRTDSGVHAFAQAANFHSPVDSVPEKNYVRALNGLLPPDVRVMDARAVPPEFHARFDATSRTYRYFMQTVEVPSARDTRYVWCLPFRPDAEVLNRMCSVLSGELDCAAFAAAGDQSRSTCRYIERARFWYEGAVLVFEIEANAFLWRMVRSLVGTLIRCAQKGKEPEFFAGIVRGRDHARALFTAPPTGLFLQQVRFDGVRRHP